MATQTQSSCPTNLGFSAGDHANSLQQLQNLVQVATTVVSQAIDVLENVLTADEQLTMQSKFLPGSTIGKHLRHARDHYALLLDCISGPKPKVLNYDTRIRNTAMESERTAAKRELLRLIEKLETIPSLTTMDEGLTLNAVTPHMCSMETTVGREIWFASLHAVHHWSMVRVITGELELQVSDDLGFAPSTLLYKGRTEAPLGKATAKI